MGYGENLMSFSGFSYGTISADSDGVSLKIWLAK